MAKFSRQFGSCCEGMCTYKTGKKKEDQTITCFGQSISEEAQGKTSLMETASQNKGRRSPAILLQNAKSGSKKQKKSCQKSREEHCMTC